MIENLLEPVADPDAPEEMKPPLFIPEPYDGLPKEAFTPPPILIHGMAYEGSKVLFSGPSKARKTWLMLHALLCIQSGKDFFGFQTERKPCLVIDLELMRPNLLRRISAIAQAAGIWDTSQLHLLSLRGRRVEFSKLREDIAKYCQQHGIGAIGIDPVYRVKTGEENSNDDAADFLLEVEAMAHEANAAIFLSHHFAKGNAAGKSSIDRMSGAGTWARDPDVLLSMTEAEQSTQDQPSFVIEPTLRDFAPVQPFAIKWHHPLWLKDEHAPTTLKGSAGRPKAGGTPAQILELIDPGEEVQSKELERAASVNFGITKKCFFELIRENLESGAIQKRKEGRSSFYARTPEQSVSAA